MIRKMGICRAFWTLRSSREDSAETIKTAEDMGVDVKMVTGDHIAIAKEISQVVNLGTNIIIPPDLIINLIE
jgi:H+-transporting ATPase